MSIVSRLSAFHRADSGLPERPDAASHHTPPTSQYTKKQPCGIPCKEPRGGARCAQSAASRHLCQLNKTQNESITLRDSLQRTDGGAMCAQGWNPYPHPQDRRQKNNFIQYESGTSHAPRNEYRGSELTHKSRSSEKDQTCPHGPTNSKRKTIPKENTNSQSCRQFIPRRPRYSRRCIAVGCVNQLRTLGVTTVTWGWSFRFPKLDLFVELRRRGCCSG